MSIFDDVVRTDRNPATYSESQFNFLNRSAWAASGEVRALLERWLTRYPEAHQAELIARFRNGDESAFFELFLHELLLSLECIVEVHPELPSGSNRRPDFKVTCKDAAQFYLEATDATGQSLTEKAQEARINQVYDAINRLDTPNFFVGVEVRGAPDTPPPGRRMREFLERQLATLNPDDIADLGQIAGLTGLPRWSFEHDGWEITFFPIAKSPKTRGKPDVRPIALLAPEGGIVTPWLPLRDALLGKAGRYGDLEVPYVIAVRAMDDLAGLDDFAQALFGDEEMVFRMAAGGPTGPETRFAPNGLWTSISGPRYTRVSAVLFARRLLPWSIRQADLTLYQNPWAQRPYACALTELSRFEADGDRLVRRAGRAASDILGVPEDWPGATGV